MKKTITGILALVMILSMTFVLAGCGTNEKKQEAIEKHTAIVTSFNEIANLINENSDKLDESIITVYQQMSDLLNQYTEILDGDDLTDEKYDEIINWFDTVEDWIDQTKTVIEASVAE